jgi:hypothetical protein
MAACITMLFVMSLFCKQIVQRGNQSSWDCIRKTWPSWRDRQRGFSVGSLVTRHSFCSGLSDSIVSRQPTTNIGSVPVVLLPLASWITADPMRMVSFRCVHYCQSCNYHCVLQDWPLSTHRVGQFSSIYTACCSLGNNSRRHCDIKEPSQGNYLLLSLYCTCFVRLELSRVSTLMSLLGHLGCLRFIFHAKGL